MSLLNHSSSQIIFIIFSCDKLLSTLAVVIGIVSIILKAINVLGDELPVIFKALRYSSKLFFFHLKWNKIFLFH